MTTSRRASFAYAAMVVAALCILVATALNRDGLRRRLHRAVVVPAMRVTDYEQWARFQFDAKFPNSKPLNWDIAAAAVRLYKEQPMGRFVLAVRPGERGNDCSDFVACVIDEGLGAGARFRRGSDEHVLGEDRRLFDAITWSSGVTVQPGDVVNVRHSPWYKPYDGACRHVGIVGSDGQVYDFAKLKVWPKPRYGRSPFEEFARNSSGPGDVIIYRLAAEYRYRMAPLPSLDQPVP